MLGDVVEIRFLDRREADSGPKSVEPCSLTLAIALDAIAESNTGKSMHRLGEGFECNKVFHLVAIDNQNVNAHGFKAVVAVGQYKSQMA